MSETSLPPIVLGLVENEDARVLLVKRTRREKSEGGSFLEWVFPGGKMKHGEEPEETVVREVLQETGYTVEAGSVITDTRHRNSACHVIYFACQHTPEPVQGSEDEAIANVAWVPKDQVEENYFNQPLNPVVSAYLDIS